MPLRYLKVNNRLKLPCEKLFMCNNGKHGNWRFVEGRKVNVVEMLKEIGLI